MPFTVVVGVVKPDATGVGEELPMVVTSAGPLLCLIDYMLSRRKSMSWRKKLARGVKLFLDYLEANAIPNEEEWRFFRGFATALHSGTIDHKTRTDPSGLYWPPAGPEDARYLPRLMTEFFRWLSDPERSPRAARFNPRWVGGTYDDRMNLAAWRYRKNIAFLGHTWLENRREKGESITVGERPPKVYKKEPPAFPENRFEELLVKGFRVAGKPDFRGMAISCLLMGAGPRISEVFQLFMVDVQPHWNDPEHPFVVIHHPSFGGAPYMWRNHQGKLGTRKEYLATEYGLIPKHLAGGTNHVGWKHPALDDNYFMQMHWLPGAIDYAKWFWESWKKYLVQASSVERNHPYAWVNLERQPQGGIYRISAYERSLEAACRRIGLVYSKKEGTTPHGFRHAYAQRARRAGITEQILQKMMHHCSPQSQKIYTQPERQEIASALSEAARRLLEESSIRELPETLFM